MKIRMVEINFGMDVELPVSWERVLIELVDMACKQWEVDNPGYIMWPAGSGSKILWREPDEPGTDDSVFAVEVACREATERDIARGRAKPRPGGGS